jgi:outer membrane protein assembly factor BamD (BamD/ComL family)
MAENPELKQFKVEEEDRNRFFLGELFWTRFELPDSAADQFKQVSERFPESLFAPKALYDLGTIRSDVQKDSVGADSVFRRLVRLYPTSPFANGGRKRLGLDLLPTRIDLANRLYHDAESLLFEKGKTDEAVALYKKIWQDDPKGELAPKAVYSLGWVYENRMDSTELAYAAYDSLVKAFPTSSFAEKVKAKVQAYESWKNHPPEAPAPPPNQGPAAPSDSLSASHHMEGVPPVKTPTISKADTIRNGPAAPSDSLSASHRMEGVPPVKTPTISKADTIRNGPAAPSDSLSASHHMERLPPIKTPTISKADTSR